MVVTREQIRDAIDSLISKYDGESTPITFSQVLGAFPALNASYGIEDAFFGSGNVNPTQSTPASGIAEFAMQYLDGHSLDALSKADDSVIARQLYDFFLKKFTSALYALFSSVQEINRKYGGLDPDANQISDQIITPSFIQVAVTADAVNGLPADITGSFTQPATQFTNVLSNSITTAAKTIGWVDHYFTVDSTLSAKALYSSTASTTGSPLLDKNTAFVVFGVLDRQGNVSGLKYANAKNNYTKPVYYGHTGLAVGETTSAARVLNNGMSMYIGQSTYGYVGIDIAVPVPKGKGTTVVDGTLTVDVDLLGIMFATAPIVQNNAY